VRITSHIFSLVYLRLMQLVNSKLDCVPLTLSKASGVATTTKWITTECAAAALVAPSNVSKGAVKDAAAHSMVIHLLVVTTPETLD
jgi:hypothetical protein